MSLWLSISFSVFLVGLALCGLAVLVVIASAKLVYQAQQRTKALEQQLADCQARVDRAIELWNEEQQARAEQERRLALYSLRGDESLPTKVM